MKTLKFRCERDSVYAPLDPPKALLGDESVKRFLVLGALGLLPAVACDDQTAKTTAPAGQPDGGSTIKTTPGVCRPSECPQPPAGIACCTPSADCGMDPTGVGLTCLPNPGSPSSHECKREADGGFKSDGKQCPEPPIGTPCCTALGGCGWDPFASGFVCFANPPPIKPLCDITKCPQTDGGAAPCCLPNSKCGVDTFGIGVCFPPPLPPPDYTHVPDDPTITGECPSFIGAFGYPLWGCCERVGKFGVCGQFQGNSCLLPVLGQIPTGPPPKADSGITEPFLRCTPPPLTSPADGGP
jgi:hypothetical protein